MAKDPSASLHDRKITAGAETSGIEREFWNLVADFEYLIQMSTTLPNEELARAKSKLHARIEAAKKSGEKPVSPLTDGARNALSDTASRTLENRWRAVGIAVGMTLMIGYLLRSRARGLSWEKAR